MQELLQKNIKIKSDWVLKFWEVMVDRKYTETLPGPFPNSSDGAWEQG